MTASVADLLDRLHRQAFTMSNLTTSPSEYRWRAQAIVWPKLAQATMRAMRNVPTGRVTDQEFMLADTILQPIALNTWIPRTTAGTPVTHVPPDRRLVDMARVVGGIADLLTTGLYGAADDPVAVLGLRANLLSPLMVAGNWTLATAPDVPATQPRVGTSLVAGIGAALAVIPPMLRLGPFDDIAAAPRTENSLDAALHHWLVTAQAALATRKGLSGVTVQTIAADLSVICGAAAALTRAAITLDQLAEDRGRPVLEAVSEANARWREASRWPQTIYLAGVRDTDLADASMRLRQAVVDTLRAGHTWATPQLITKRMPRQDLLAVARRAMRIAHEAGELQQAAVTNLFLGTDRVMMASRALEGATFMNKAVFNARRRGEWVPMPRYEPVGLEVYRAATNASNATFSARQLAVATANPAVARQEPTRPSPSISAKDASPHRESRLRRCSRNA